MSEERKLALRKNILWAYLFLGLISISIANLMAIRNFLTIFRDGQDPTGYHLLFDMHLNFYTVIFLIIGFGLLMGWRGLRKSESWGKPIALISGVMFIIWEFLLAFNSFVNGQTVVAIMLLFVAIGFANVIYFLTKVYN